MVENVIPRKYNYQLETGVVGTDDNDMANVLYNINRMEIKAAYEGDDIDDMRLAFGEAYSMTIEAADHLDDFIENHNGKLNPETVEKAQFLLSDAVVVLDDVEPPQTDMELMSAAMKNAYQKMTEAVPFLVSLDEQSL